MTSPATGAPAPTIFTFQSSTVRTLTIAGEPWFVLSDVTEILGFSRSRDAARILDDDEKGAHIVRTPGGDREVTIISESGVYALVLRSRRPEARPFRKWVTAEVLPAIRQTGRYQSPLPTAAVALPSPDTLSSNLRSRIKRKAHALSLDQFDTLHDLIEEMVVGNLRCGASESACEAYIERFGSGMGGVTLVTWSETGERDGNHEDKVRR